MFARRAYCAEHSSMHVAFFFITVINKVKEIMKLLLSLLGVTCAVASPPAEINQAFVDVESFVRAPSPAAHETIIKKNAAISDRDIEAWMVFALVEPAALKNWQAQSAKARVEWLQKYREEFNSRAEKIPTLSDFPAAELVFMRAAWISQITARTRLANTPHQEHQRIAKVCVKLISRRTAVAKQQRPPLWTQTYSSPGLAFLNPVLIRVADESCWIFLDKGIGVGIGFELKKNGQYWQLASFDEYLSWKRKVIKY
jgi:hypothetical protein